MVEAADGVVSKTVVEHPDPAEQSCIVTLQLLRTQMEDAGKFTLTATNKNGSDQVDLDLIVLDDVPVCDCDMFLNGSLECTCNNRFRAEEGDKVIRKKKRKTFLTVFCSELEPDQQRHPSKRGELPTKCNEHQLKHELGELKVEHFHFQENFKKLLLPSRTCMVWWEGKILVSNPTLTF